MAVVRDVGVRAGRDTARDRGGRDRGRDLQDQAWVEGLRDDVLRAEHRGRTAIRGGHDLAGLHARQHRDGLDAGDLHLLVDRGGAYVQRAAEDEREAQDVVDLIGIIGAAGGHDRVGARGAHRFGQDFRIRIGQGKDQRLGAQAREPLGLQHARRGESEEDVAAGERILERAGVGALGVAGHVVAHAGPVGQDHPVQVGEYDVLDAQAHGHQEVHAGERGGAGAGGDQAHIG